MNKPQTVHKEAVWNKKEQEWELGTKNRRGDEVGEWKWWAKEGHLCCRTFFDNDGLIESAQRFHPNGEVSLDLVTVGDRHRHTYYRCEAPTNEYFPNTVYGDAWKAVQNEGVPISFSYFSQDGRLLNAAPQSLEQLQTGPEGETADEALARYQKVLDLHRQTGDEYANDFIQSDCELNFYRQVSEAELSAAEEKIGYRLPPSYKNFVLKHGLLSFGQDEFGDEGEMGRHRLVFEPISKTMYSWSLNAEQAKQLQPILAMCGSGRNDGSAYCFDFRSQNPETAETNIYMVCEDDCYQLLKYPPKAYAGLAYDDFMSYLINEKIEYMVGALGAY